MVDQKADSIRDQSALNRFRFALNASLLQRCAYRFGPILTVPVVLGLWQTIVTSFQIKSYILPAPSDIIAALLSGLSDGTYLSALEVTITEVLIGFFIGSALGMILGLIASLFPFAGRLMMPWIVAVQTVPKVAIAPLMIVWMGFGIQSKIVIVAFTCLFPVLVNTVSGIKATDPMRISLLRAYGASRMQLARYVLLPGALPYIFAGIKTGMVLALLAAMVGEFVGAQEGIGVLILKANFNLDLATVFALLVILALVGTVMSGIIRFIELRACFWSGKSS